MAAPGEAEPSVDARKIALTAPMGDMANHVLDVYKRQVLTGVAAYQSDRRAFLVYFLIKVNVN